MNYPEYKAASVRHLNTCKQLLNILPNLNNAHIEKEILLNIYYLSGYIIECIVNYAIYDYLKFNPTADVLTLSPQNNACKVSFYNKAMLYNKYGIKAKPKYVIQTHNFQLNCQFFAANGISDASKVPHFDTFIPDMNLKKLFDTWKPEVRYVDYGFSKQEIISFYNLSEDIHNKTRIYITKN